jgi:hypothetical protein
MTSEGYSDSRGVNSQEFCYNERSRFDDANVARISLEIGLHILLRRAAWRTTTLVPFILTRET